MNNNIKNLERDLINNLVNKFNEIIIEGLKIKGYDFKNKNDLMNFIKERCRVEDNYDIKRKIYYVDNTPFLLHFYETTINLPKINNDFYTISASIGYYKYL